MGFKAGLLIGAAAGYVLGSKAGRERYEQIMEGWARISGDDRLQDIASKGRAVVDLAAERVKDSVGDRFEDTDDEA